MVSGPGFPKGSDNRSGLISVNQKVRMNKILGIWFFWSDPDFILEGWIWIQFISNCIRNTCNYPVNCITIYNNELKSIMNTYFHCVIEIILKKKQKT